MIHECNRALEDIWSAAVTGQAVNHPSQPNLLSHAFMTRRFDAEHHTFSYVGPELRVIHGRDLIGHNLLDLWANTCRDALRGAIESALATGSPLIARTRGRRIDGGAIEFEVTLWPLRGPTLKADRLLGAIAPCVAFQGDRPVMEHVLDELTPLPPHMSRPPPRVMDLARLLIEARPR